RVESAYLATLTPEDQALANAGNSLSPEAAAVLAATGVGADALWVSADPERRCGPYRWLYPGDELRLAVPPEVGATAAALTVAVVSDGMPRLSIGVAQGGELVVDLPWIPGANVASFLRPVEALPPNAEIVVRNDADRRLVLITEVALRPAEP
ncbi:MAG: hypothetical protein ABMA64_33165, partial [Myxococcota bacterium]